MPIPVPARTAAVGSQTAAASNNEDVRADGITTAPHAASGAGSSGTGGASSAGDAVGAGGGPHVDFVPTGASAGGGNFDIDGQPPVDPGVILEVDAPPCGYPVWSNDYGGSGP